MSVVTTCATLGTQLLGDRLKRRTFLSPTVSGIIPAYERKEIEQNRNKGGVELNKPNRTTN